MKKHILYPIVFALYPALSLWLENYDQVLLSDVFPTLVLILVIFLLAWSAIYLLTRQPAKSAMLASVFMVLFFAFGYLVLLVKILSNKYSSWHRVDWLVNSPAGMGVLLLLWLGIFLAFAFLVLKSRSRLVWLSTFFNVVAVIILVFLAFNWASLVLGERRQAVAFIQEWHRRLQAEYPARGGAAANPPLPDIYYIFLDGYGRQDILQELYGYDNHQFLDFLEHKGFYLADQSKTNYSQTIYSLASSLNFQFLDELPEKLGETNQSLLPVRGIAADNRLFQRLRQEGYLIRNIPSGFLLTDHLNADVTIVPWWRLNAFQNQLVSASPIPAFLDLFSLQDQYDLHRQRILYAFAQLSKRPTSSQPVFTFTHILAPHPPFVMDSEGRPVEHTGLFILKDGSQFVGSQEEYIQGFRQQTIYVSRLVEQAVEQILSASQRPVIIILQSDHGPGSHFVWEDWERTYLPERMSVLNAYYFPGGDYTRLYPGITPVNTFRVVLSQFFGDDLPLLEDRNYFTSLYNPYRFQDVTGIDE